MRTKAFVMETKEDRAHVLVFRQEACGSCSASGACTAKQASDQWIDNTIHAKPGNLVVLEMKEGTYLRSVFLLYVLPLLLFLGGLFLTYALSGKEVWAFFGGLAGLVIFAGLARLIEKRERKDLVKMIRIASKDLTEQGTVVCQAEK